MRKQVPTATLQVAIKIEHAHAHVDTHTHPRTLTYASGARWRHLRGSLRRTQNSFTCGCFNAAARYKIPLSGNCMMNGRGKGGEDICACFLIIRRRSSVLPL